MHGSIHFFFTHAVDWAVVKLISFIDDSTRSWSFAVNSLVLSVIWFSLKTFSLIESIIERS